MSFSLKSNASDRELVFSLPRPDYFVVELRGRALEVTREVYAHTDARGLSEFFAKLAVFEHPWVGTQRWESLEGEFSISAACSVLGQVSFSIRIRDMLGDPEEWEVSAQLATEFGALPAVAADARVFFNVVASA